MRAGKSVAGAVFQDPPCRENGEISRETPRVRKVRRKPLSISLSTFGSKRLTQTGQVGPALCCVISNLPRIINLPSRCEVTVGGVAPSRKAETPNRGQGPVFAVVTTRNVNVLLDSRLRERCRCKTRCGLNSRSIDHVARHRNPGAALRPAPRTRRRFCPSLAGRPRGMPPGARVVLKSPDRESNPTRAMVQ